MRGIISRLAFVSTFLVHVTYAQAPGARPGGAPLGEPSPNYLATVNQNQQQIHEEKSGLEKRSYREEDPAPYGRPDYGKAHENIDPCVSCCRACSMGNIDDEYEYGGYGRYDDYSSSRFDPSYDPYNRYDPPVENQYQDPYSRYDPPTYDPPPPRYDPPTYDPPPRYDPITYDPPQRYDPPTYDPPRYDPPTYDPPRYDPPRYDPQRYDPPKYDLRSRCGSGYNRYYDDYTLQSEDPYYYGPNDRPSNRGFDRGEFSDPRSNFGAPSIFGRAHGDPEDAAPAQMPPQPQQMPPQSFPNRSPNQLPPPPYQPQPPPNYLPKQPPPQYYPIAPQQPFGAP